MQMKLRPRKAKGRAKRFLKRIGVGLCIMLLAISLVPGISVATGDAAVLIPYFEQVIETAQKYQESFNKYVTKFNTFMETAENTKKFVNRMQNIDEEFLQTKHDVEDILNGFVGKTGGDWTKLRLQRLNLGSIAIAKYFKSMSSQLDSIEQKVKADATVNGIEGKPVKVATVQLRKEVELKNMRAEATLAASAQRQEAMGSLLGLAKSGKGRSEAQMASSAVTQEELQKRILEQLVLANRLTMIQIEIQTHGRPLLPSDKPLTAKDFESTWSRIEKDANYD